MAENRTQIGWYIQESEEVIHNMSFSYAAWWENIRVAPGKYPVYVYDMRIREDGEVCERNAGAAGTYTIIPGIVVEDYFASHYFGMPISDYDTKQNAGKASSYTLYERSYAIAEEILEGRSKYELLPEYEAREIHFTYDGEDHVTHGIFKRDCENRPTVI